MNRFTVIGIHTMHTHGAQMSQDYRQLEGSTAVLHNDAVHIIGIQPDTIIGQCGQWLLYKGGGAFGPLVKTF